MKPVRSPEGPGEIEASNKVELFPPSGGSARLDSLLIYVSDIELATEFFIKFLGYVEINRISDKFGETRTLDLCNGALDLIQLYDPVEEQPLAPHPQMLTYSIDGDPIALLEEIELWLNTKKVEAGFDKTDGRARVTMLKLIPAIFNIVKKTK